MSSLGFTHTRPRLNALEPSTTTPSPLPTPIKPSAMSSISFQDQVVIVTGAGSGIGRVLVHPLPTQAHRLIPPSAHPALSPFSFLTGMLSSSLASEPSLSSTTSAGKTRTRLSQRSRKVSSHPGQPPTLPPPPRLPSRSKISPRPTCSANINN